MRLATFVLGFVAMGCSETLDVLDAGSELVRDGGTSDAAATPDAGSDARIPNVALLATDVACGMAHTCAIADGELFCWGDDSQGAVRGASGGPDPVGAPVPLGVMTNATAVTAGEHFSCAQGDDGRVACWGANAVGQLGAGDTALHDAPSMVPLPGRATTLAGVFAHSCALLDDDSLRCWGENREGQMGLGDPFPGMNALSPVQTTSELDFIAVGTAQGHTCAIRAPGNLWCWGRNVQGELGIGLAAGGQIRAPQPVGSETDWVLVVGSQFQTCGIRAPGSLWCWGDNAAGELGTGDTMDRDLPIRIGVEDDWTQVSVHAFAACGLRTGQLFCWGRNIEGQLGTGDTTDRRVPTRIGTDFDWARVSVGRFHTCATKEDGTLWCTGENVDGRLGTGDFMRRNTFTKVLVPTDPLQ